MTTLTTHLDLIRRQLFGGISSASVGGGGTCCRCCCRRGCRGRRHFCVVVVLVDRREEVGLRARHQRQFVRLSPLLAIAVVPEGESRCTVCETLSSFWCANSQAFTKDSRKTSGPEFWAEAKTNMPTVPYQGQILLSLCAVGEG